MTLHNARNSAVRGQGRQGAVGGVRIYVCITHRSEKMDVNHITYILVYTEHGSKNRGISRTIFFILQLGLDTGGEMCKTIYN